MKRTKWGRLVMLPIVCLLLGGLGCQSAENEMKKETTYTQITMSDAQELMEKETDYIILDVRTQAEYAEGHIPGAICIPNEEIGEAEPEQLPVKEQLILVYCRSGNRSKHASEKLAAMGYTNIKEFGGIIDWDGEIEK